MSTTSSAAKTASEAPAKKQPVGGKRALEKTSWLGGSAALEELEDDNSSVPFDQFKGKTTNYTDDIYSTSIDHSRVTNDQKKRALDAERDIAGAATTNRHVAEERNQIELRVDGEVNNEEEAKYGAAADRRNTRIASNQDGGIFNNSAGRQGSSAATPSQKITKKNITAPAGKFKTFK